MLGFSLWSSATLEETAGGDAVIMRDNKGFTVYELAIVLIIIGLIMGLVLKVNAIIDVARLKKECAKFENMRSAFTIYYKMYKGLPGADKSLNGTGLTILANSETARNELIRASLLNENDFVVNINPAKDEGYRYYFARCVADDGYKVPRPSGWVAPLGKEPNGFVFYPGSNKNVTDNLSVPSGSVCVGAYNSAGFPLPANNNSFNGFMNTTPQSVRAAYELYFDDKRIDHGYGRRAYDSLAPFDESTFDETIGNYQSEFDKEIKFLQEQVYGTDFISSGGISVPNTYPRAGTAYFVKIF
jgi:competence protein ComGC